MSAPNLPALIRELITQPRETEWLEFKHNNSDPTMIGERISALANSAALNERQEGYFVWGIDDATHQIVGTTFTPRTSKVKGQELESWLGTHFHPRVDFRIHELEIEGWKVVLFVIPAARQTPVRFMEYEYIRVGSHTNKLRDHPEKERAMWRVFSRSPFEDGFAASGVSASEVLQVIDHPKCFSLLQLQKATDENGVLDRLLKERVIQKDQDGRYSITNLGAILFARNLTEFDSLARKALRVIQYAGKDRIRTIKEQRGARGYAVGFEGAVTFINDLLPHSEEIGAALRSAVRVYPEIAIRELLANVLIHQEFDMRGTGPMVEIFSDRIEFANPGKPLIDPLRFIDNAPQSRNETLAAMMRRMNICEERGSGVDKVVFNVELFQLPAPNFQVADTHTRVTLFGKRKLAEMDKEDRVRACYQHACLQFVRNEQMTNTSMRARFAIEEKNYAMASRIISDAIEAKLIKIFDPANTSKRHTKYVPFWA